MIYKPYINRKIISEETEYIKDCSIFVTESMIESCSGNENLIKQQALLEGLKIDNILKNLMSGGKDSSGLKNDLQKVIDVTNMDASQLKSHATENVGFCKSLLVKVTQLGSSMLGAGANKAVASKIVGTAAPKGLMGLAITNIPAIIVGAVTGKILGLALSTQEYSKVKKDCQDMVTLLRNNAKKMQR